MVIMTGYFKNMEMSFTISSDLYKTIITTLAGYDSKTYSMVVEPHEFLTITTGYNIKLRTTNPAIIKDVAESLQSIQKANCKTDSN